MSATSPSAGRADAAPDDAVVVVDLGGTQIRTAIFDSTGVMLSRRTVPTPRLAGQAEVIGTVISQIRQSLAEHHEPVRSVAVSALGPVDPRAGVIRTAPTLHDFDNVPLAEQLEYALQLPVHVYNDANAATVAEWRLGAGRDTQNFCYVTVSTGIGCGTIANGQLLTGHSGYAGELGRLRVTGPHGNLVRLEEISSGTAIAATARAALLGPVSTSLRDLADPARISAADVAGAASADDTLAQQILHTAADSLGTQLANVIRITDPEVVAIGGGVTLAGDHFWTPLRNAVATSLAHDAIPIPRLCANELHGDAGLHGAALALLDQPRRTRP